MTERIGEHWILSSADVDSEKHYYISSKKIGDIRWVFTDNEKAVDKFEYLESHYSERNKNEKEK